MTIFFPKRQNYLAVIGCVILGMEYWGAQTNEILKLHVSFGKVCTLNEHPITKIYVISIHYTTSECKNHKGRITTYSHVYICLMEVQNCLREKGVKLKRNNGDTGNLLDFGTLKYV